MSDISSPDRRSNVSSQSSPGRMSAMIEVKGNMNEYFNSEDFTEFHASITEVSTQNRGSSYVIAIGHVKIPITSEMEIILETSSNLLILKDTPGFFLKIRIANELALQKWYRAVTHGIVRAKASVILQNDETSTVDAYSDSSVGSSIIDNPESKDLMLRVMKRLYTQKTSPPRTGQKPAMFPADVNGSKENIDISLSATNTSSTKDSSSDDGSTVSRNGTSTIYCSKYNLIVFLITFLSS